MNVSGRSVWLWRTCLNTTLHRCAVLRALVPHLTRLTINQKAKLIDLIREDIVYALAMMYRIRRDDRVTHTVCLACTHTERVRDFKRGFACDGMVMERQCSPGRFRTVQRRTCLWTIL